MLSAMPHQRIYAAKRIVMYAYARVGTIISRRSSYSGTDIVPLSASLQIFIPPKMDGGISGVSAVMIDARMPSRQSANISAAVPRADR